MLNNLEEAARRAKEAVSYRDYKEGSATAEYNEYCKQAEEIAKRAKAKLAKTCAPKERAERVDYLLALYKSKKLSWLCGFYANMASVPSVMIAGPSNFPARAKQKQIAREQALMAQNPDYILDEIRAIGNNSGTIYSDEENAVERIKAKIERLKTMPDPYGNNAAEIRRLKGRLLQLAPQEFAEQQANVAVNGAKTYDEIVALWETGTIHKSEFDPDNPAWYYDLSLDFTDGKRHFREFISIEVDETGQNMVSYNYEKREKEFIPLTDAKKYGLIIGRIAGSGNKAVIYQHLKNLRPEVQKVQKPAETAEIETVTINGESAKVVRNKQEMRLQLIFDSKPDTSTREKLKSNGFRWAPSHGAWQRLLNYNAELALKRIADR